MSRGIVSHHQHRLDHSKPQPVSTVPSGADAALGTSSTDNDAKLHSHAKQIRVSRIGLEDAN